MDTVESNCRSEAKLTLSCTLRCASREPDGLRKHTFILDHQAQFISHMQLPLRGGGGGGESPMLKGSLGLRYLTLKARLHRILSEETQGLKPLAANPQQLRAF